MLTLKLKELHSWRLRTPSRIDLLEPVDVANAMSAITWEEAMREARPDAKHWPSSKVVQLQLQSPYLQHVLHPAKQWAPACAHWVAAGEIFLLRLRDR